jgi:hypothetical protein
MPALVAGIYVLKALQDQRRGWPGQARPRRTEWLVSIAVGNNSLSKQISQKQISPGRAKQPELIC